MFLLFVGFSMALGCDDIKTMIDARMPSDIIIETIKNSSYKSSEEDLICLLKYSNIDINVINYLLNINNSGKKMELSFDCLAGFCLNQESGSLGDDVFLIGNKYNVVRSIEVCGRMIHKDVKQYVFGQRLANGTRGFGRVKIIEYMSKNKMYSAPSIFPKFRYAVSTLHIPLRALVHNIHDDKFNFSFLVFLISFCKIQNDLLIP